MVEAVGGEAASVRSVNATAIATAIATALPIHTSRNVSAEARELEPPLLAGAGFLALPLPAPPFGFGILPFPIFTIGAHRDPADSSFYIVYFYFTPSKQASKIMYLCVFD